MDLYIAHLLTLRIEMLHSFADRSADAAHSHDHSLGIRCAVVIEDVVIFAGDGIDLLHILLYHSGKIGICTVVGFAELEVHIGILHGVAQRGMAGIQRILAEFLHGIPVQHLAKFLVRNGADLLDLVAGAEAVKEMDEGYAAANGGQMCHTGQIHNFLHAAGREHGKTRLPAVHHVAVVTEDGHSVSSHGTGCYMNDTGLAGTADAVQNGDHQHQTLRRCKGSGQRAGLQGTVHSADGACFRLHFHQRYRLGEEIFATVCGPLVRFFRHRRGRCNRINCCDFGECVGYICCSFVAVYDHNLLVLIHCQTSRLC